MSVFTNRGVLGYFFYCYPLQYTSTFESRPNFCAFMLLSSVVVAAVAMTVRSSDCAESDPTQPIELSTGDMTVFVAKNGTYTLKVGSEPPVRGAALSAFVDGKLHTQDNGGLVCSPAACVTGSDRFGDFVSAELRCNVSANKIPAIYSWRAYKSTEADTATGGERGRMVMGLTLPRGANDTAAQPNFSIHNSSPIQFAPFPSWKIEGAFASAAFLCYGGDKSHLYSLPSLEMSSKQSSCFALGNGPATLLWPKNAASTNFMPTLVAGPASSFHLNYHRVINPGSPPPKFEQAVLFYNAKRGDATLCLSETCKRTQIASGYEVLSANEGSSKAKCDAPACVLLCPDMDTCCCAASGADYEPLFFSWSAQKQDNWVTNTTDCPGACETTGITS